ncbi:MAG: protein kinase, partial [Acidobacteriia bacterium]|nr:protein kinase [Terriglobia bacterium]
PVPLDDALAIARQIAGALQAAHDKGIVHRDLKPANIMLTADGRVKVLDFGLAKVEAGKAGGAGGAGRETQSPTLTFAATQAGVILGTAAYMSPEQAKGRVADKRADVWAFGCVLYEMLAGKRAFGGEDLTDTMAAVVRGEPDWNALPPNLPFEVRTIVTRCLEKDRAQRLPDISVALFLLNEPRSATAASAPPMATSRPLWKRALPFAITAAIAAAVAGAIGWSVRPSPSTPVVTRFTIPLGDGQQFTNSGRQVIAVSPDGAKIVYVANQRLYLRAMSEAEAHPIAGSENAVDGVTSPVFSPDGQWIAFYSQNAVKKVAIAGGAPVTLCAATNPYGMSWDRDNILIGQGAQGILRVSAAGGTPERIVSVKDGELAHGPQMLPGGDAVLFTLMPATPRLLVDWDKAQIVTQSLKSGERKTLVSGGADARYLPSGHLVYALSGVLLGVRFDPRRLTITGGPVPIVEGVLRATVRGATGTAQFSTSNGGSLVYLAGPSSTLAQATDVALMDRQGNLQRLKLPPAPYVHARVSPDGKRLAVGTDDGNEAALWIYEVSGATSIRRLTFNGRNQYPVWSPDGSRIAFQSDREGDQGIFWQRADGAGVAERVTKGDPGTGLQQMPEAWSPDGKVLLFSKAMGSNYGLYTVSLSDKHVARVGDLASVNPFSAAFSPDGRWIAYDVNGSTGERVFVQPFPATGATYEVTADKVIHPFWSPDGKDLFVHPIGGLMRLGVTVKSGVSFSAPQELPRGSFLDDGPAFERNMDVMPDGKHFVGVVSLTSNPSPSRVEAVPQIHVVENWFEELTTKVK